MDSGRIFYIIGKSASGKDSMYKELLKKTGLKVYTMYTTRPRREYEVQGREYNFTGEDELRHLREEKKVIEERTYMTVHGPWVYYTVDDGSFDTGQDLLMIGTLESFISMKKYMGAGRVFPIYIECDDGVRLQRAMDREKKSSTPDYKEMCRRFLADSEDFSEEKLEAAGITKRFENMDIAECRDNIIEYIDYIKRERI
ncbi:MAG: guanylate kinase [Lachnospiraceae bacterium]|nr:guanylate kinase [Lachnospiraceae bacterium]